MSSSCLNDLLVADSDADKASAQRLVDAHDADTAHDDEDDGEPPPSKRQCRLSPGCSDDDDGGSSGVAAVEEYFSARDRLAGREGDLAFDGRCRGRASSLERRVDAIVQRLRLRDSETIYGAAPRVGDRLGQLHRRFAGDHYLSNVDLIDRTAVLDVARRMPKGAHLHIHFNACLDPRVLLDIAKGMERMFITSDLPLVPADGGDGDGRSSFDLCEIRFSICCQAMEEPGDIFAADYRPRQTMKFSEFRDRFHRHYDGSKTVDDWLADKLVFHDDEAHNLYQTAAGAWERFNIRTRMMKGLFNYETAYRRYTRLCLEDLARDNIQYAEIRPNFMASNQLYVDDGTSLIDNWGIMDLIIQETQRFLAEQAAERGGPSSSEPDGGRAGSFAGLKVIYCTPRSLSREQVGAALDECLRFKLRWPRWVAGFDLVGEEAAGHPLREFVPELLRFRRDCREAGVTVPFLFHCGETVDLGTDTDGNLLDALLLGAPRIGHGFALPRHPYVMQLMKARGVCVELCPISNEVLGLTPRVSGHAMYELLANNVHCTVSSDNGTMFRWVAFLLIPLLCLASLFFFFHLICLSVFSSTSSVLTGSGERSSLSHDFYQVMIGKADMGLPGWKQLILWSMEHACLDEQERTDMLKRWEERWEVFLRDVVETYGHLV
ncbi:adenosine deaminase CECR1 [Geosmithia morbida]|uniref:Adenosine deaminase CECR1 n=1 Tax=Geosmithia morbida TaxID=1094350 RepID=A0A9P4YU26_9HYPO|nr:adenosine deaminase CECR1 [Geosmithia morbida]KAF4122080.1 adenosine deaminase CECR1 [Geosmithia morbida]